MQIRAELCHVDTLRCVVRVEAWNDGALQGSALGEAATAEDAEDRALERLNAGCSKGPHNSLKPNWESRRQAKGRRNHSNPAWSDQRSLSRTNPNR